MSCQNTKKQNTLLFDNDIKYVVDLEDDQGFVFRMNINSRLSGNLHSCLENIYNTIKDRPDIDLIQHDMHMFSSYPHIENETFSFKDEVLIALTIMREFEDVMLDKSMEQYKLLNREDIKSIQERPTVIVKLNEENKVLKK